MTEQHPVRTALRGIRAAFVFLTRVPVGGGPYTPGEWSWAPGHFPLVGLVLGVLLAFVHRGLRPLGPLADGLSVVGVSLLLTGALHEDGLADTSDALGGAWTRDRVLEILKDGRVGTFGASALVFSIVGRAALLARLGHGSEWALPLVNCAARVGPVWQMALLPHVSPTTARSAAVLGAARPQAIAATAWFALAGTAAIALSVVSTRDVIALSAACGLIALATGWQYARRLGGFTGDFLGATEQACEIAGYAVLVWTAGA
jgi:adenosylcobinamide-GDP ribazoletransferase